MIIDGEQIDTQRDDIPGDGCREESCPKYYEVAGVGRCGDCRCILRAMRAAGKTCPVAARRGEREHSGAYGTFQDYL